MLLSAPITASPSAAPAAGGPSPPSRRPAGVGTRAASFDDLVGGGRIHRAPRRALHSMCNKLRDREHRPGDRNDRAGRGAGVRGCEPLPSAARAARVKLSAAPRRSINSRRLNSVTSSARALAIEKRNDRYSLRTILKSPILDGIRPTNFFESAALKVVLVLTYCSTERRVPAADSLQMQRGLFVATTQDCCPAARPN